MTARTLVGGGLGAGDPALVGSSGGRTDRGAAGCVQVATVHRLLAARGATLAAAESLTGGLLAAALTALPGSSAWFRGGVVAYATDLKASLLGVPAALLAAHGPVHPEVALAMAEGVRRCCRAVYGVGLTGVAGPEPQGGQPVGTVHVAVVGPDGFAARSPHLSGGRESVRRDAVRVALDLLCATLEQRSDP